MITNNISITKDLYIWAIPNPYFRPDFKETEFCKEDAFYKEMQQFTTEVSFCDTNYSDNSALIHQTTMTVDVPNGVDMTAKAVENIEKQEEELDNEYYIRKGKLHEAKQNLLAIEYQAA